MSKSLKHSVIEAVSEAPIAALRESLQEIDAKIEERRWVLRELWDQAPRADRILAIERLLLQRGTIPTDKANRLQDLNERVYELWMGLRTSRKHKDHPHTLRRVIEGQAECRRAEEMRDNFIVDNNLVDAVLAWAESFISPAFRRQDGSFSDMIAHRQAVVAKINEAEARRRRFHSELSQLPEATQVRFLPALSASGEAGGIIL